MSQGLWQHCPSALSALLGGGVHSEGLRQGLQQLAQGQDAAPALLVSLCTALAPAGAQQPQPGPSQGALCLISVTGLARKAELQCAPAATLFA